MMDWEKADVAQLAGELIDTGLATPNPYNHLSLDPALCPYLRRTLDDSDRDALTPRWVDAMRGYVHSLYAQQRGQNPELAATLTLLELPNLLALLAHVLRAGDAEATIDLTTHLQSLLSTLLAGDAAGVASFLDELAAHPQLSDQLRPFVTALQTIVAGSRGRSLAEAPELHFTSAAELLVLLDVLEAEAEAETDASS